MFQLQLYYNSQIIFNQENKKVFFVGIPSYNPFLYTLRKT